MDVCSIFNTATRKVTDTKKPGLKSGTISVVKISGWFRPLELDYGRDLEGFVFVDQGKPSGLAFFSLLPDYRCDAISFPTLWPLCLLTMTGRHSSSQVLN